MPDSADRLGCQLVRIANHTRKLALHMSDITLRSAYTPPAFLVTTVELDFDLDPASTRVTARLSLRHNPASTSRQLTLQGDGQELLSVRINGEMLDPPAYTLSTDALLIEKAPEQFTLEIVTLIHPDQNTTLMGLYVSQGNFFTQCEAEGFRKITYFPDRPDVMAKYTVLLRADKQRYPVLLSNGNLLEQGDLDDGRHYARWEDPFNKPSYLFALVAGDLVCQSETFRLDSGREVLLQVWVEPGNLDKTGHAMESLKNSIRWDQQRYCLELDLERFMIVAVGDFNMGAMENKGLNIFNTKYVLANPRIATDSDYANIEAVVGHEYFHNWTGNRVTCRDWFQLSLKEGLTVFRDQEFSADMAGTESGRAVKRIQNVRLLRQVQFAEDSGTMAHPVRPDSYREISNFYTATIYNKGAEVVRMYQTLLGRDGFRKGMDLYFARHDGQAVTCDDFRMAMSDANGRDLAQFERWYSQPGTPHVQVQTHYDASAERFDITLTQSTHDQPLHIPISVGLLDAQGMDLPLKLSDETGHDTAPTTRVLELTDACQTYSFTGIKSRPTLSLLRGFSAPVTLDYAVTDEELAHLLAHDSDPFNRWEAGQRLAMQRLLKLTARIQAGESLALDDLFIDALRLTLNDTTLDPAFRAQVLSLPTEATLAEQFDVIDPQAIHAACRFMRQTLSERLRSDFIAAYQDNLTPGAYDPDTRIASRRTLKNLCLAYLLERHDDSALAQTQLADADNITDRVAALSALLNADPESAAHESANQALEDFYDDFENEALVIDKWFSLQATAPSTDVAAIRRLIAHPAFTLNNPNRARSLIFSFCNGNAAQFHTADGYVFWAEQVLALDAINPQVAARLARTLDHWKKYLPNLRDNMNSTLQMIEKSGNLSKDTQEVISKALV